MFNKYVTRDFSWPIRPLLNENPLSMLGMLSKEINPNWPKNVYYIVLLEVVVGSR